MTENPGEWPFKRGPIAKIWPPDGRGWEAVSLAVGRWYAALEFPWHSGNIGFLTSGAPNGESSMKRIKIDIGMMREAKESES